VSNSPEKNGGNTGSSEKHYNSLSMNITTLFHDAAKKFPQHFALIHQTQILTYSEFEERITETAAYFTHKGIAKGDRVLVFVPMSIDLYRILLALLEIGAVAVLLDEWVSRERMELCCRIAKCKGFIAPPKIRVLSFLSKEIRSIPIKLSIKGRVPGQNINIMQCSEEDSALITFTTGSTGIPKAADRSHGFLKQQFTALLETIEPTPDDIDMPVLPVVLLMNLGTGCSSVIADWKSSKPEKMNAALIAQQILANSITRITASPFFLLRLASHLIKEKSSLSSVKKIFTGGAPVFPSEAAILLEAFPGADIKIIYGSTETEPISEIGAGELARMTNEVVKGLPVGKIYANAQVRIIKIEDDNIQAATHQELEKHLVGEMTIGEIIVSGDHVLKKYFNNPEALRRNKIICEDTVWHRTGDSGYIDSDGNLFLAGRCNTLFYQDDLLVSPFLVEGFLRGIPEVLIGTVLKKNGKTCLFVELAESANRQDVEKRISSLGMKIDEIIYCKIPRDPRHFSKIDYPKLIS
jgi:acyl-CoA synthetase (AMP-forming)/AMP-acid ligase II